MNRSRLMIPLRLEKNELNRLKRRVCAAAGMLVAATLVAAKLSADGSGHKPSQPQTLTYTVTNTSDSGSGSLRQAIVSANSNPGMDLIHFNIPGEGVHTIKPTSVLPDITDTVVIDGLTQQGASNASWPPSLKVELDGSLVSGWTGLTVLSTNSLIRGLIINRFSVGISLFSGFNQIKCNFIGTDPSGTLALGNTIKGIDIAADQGNNTIGGLVQGERNLISGNLIGVLVFSESPGNLVQGNYIGTNAQGSAALANTNGIIISNSSNNIVGGASAGARNVISGNTGAGVLIRDTPSDGTAVSNVVAGNYIGTDATGTLPLGNGEYGVRIVGGSSDNTIGGTTPGSRNVISGNASGIGIDSGSTHNFVQGNFIGTDHSGSAALGNRYYGVLIENGSQNTIGGTAVEVRNVISGTQDFAGVGIFLEGSIANLVQGNFIGTDALGSGNLGNVFGVIIAAGATNNAIGGAAGGARNVISGNFVGVTIYNTTASNTTNNRVEANYIGLDASGNAPLGNSGWGVRISQGANGNFIGGLQAGTGNKIAFSGYAGVAIQLPAATTGNCVARNLIFANGGLGIDLITSPDSTGGITANDPGDFDLGPNNLQNYPILTSASAAGVVSGSLNSTANTLFRIEFFASGASDPSGQGEGEVFLGSQNVTTNFLGNASFTFTFSPVAGKPFISATATNPLTGDTSEFSPSVAPTAVELDSFAASAYDGGVLIEWQTGFEVDNLGFRLYREEAGQRKLVNPEMIAGSALLAGSTTILRAGQSYAWWDKLQGGTTAAQYWLEDFDLNGQSTWHGPFAVKQVGGSPPARSQAELLSRKGRSQLGPALPLTRNSNHPGDTHPIASGTVLPPSDVNLASLPAIKIATRGEGWYRVERQELLAAGLDPNVQPQFLQMFTGGVMRPIVVTGEKDGVFDVGDTVEFYAEGLETPFTDLQVHWLVSSAQPGLRVAAAESGAGEDSATGFASTVERRDRTIYFSALRNGERENFFGSVITAIPVEQTIDIRYLDSEATEQATLEVALQGVTIEAHRVGILFNGAEVGEAVFANQDQGAAKISLPHSLVRDGSNEVKLTALGGGSDVSLVDYIRLTYRRKYVAEGDSLIFTATGGQLVAIDGFTAGDIRVLDVTDPGNAKEVRAKIEPQGSSYVSTIVVSGDGERRLLALGGNQARSAFGISANVPSQLRQNSNVADLVIITRSDFAGAFDQLSAFRQSQGLAVALIDIEDIYDEFNQGRKSPQAVKDFLAYAKSNWKRGPGYVLLGGDASLDPKNYLGLGDFDFVPTKLIDTDYLETASDDWLADFNDDGIAELAVGRLSVRSLEEAVAMSGKIIGYEKGDRAGSLALVSDTNDGFDFEAALSQLRPLIPDDVKVVKIKRGETDAKQVKQRLLDAINDGQRIVNYAGHGSINQWRGDLLTSADAREMKNEILSVFVMMTCLNGYFQDPAVVSIAESLMSAERGGAVAVWASAGMTLPVQQALMNQEFYRLIFSGSTAPRLGEAARRAKWVINDADIRRTWVLLGDPTMKLR